VLYTIAFGGLFALAFAGVFGRIGSRDPRIAAAILAALGFIAIVVVPGIKYPANPPSIGNPATIGLRTGLFFLMMAVSLAAMIGASLLSQRLAESYGRWNGWRAGTAFFLAVVLVAGFILPPINEVPEGFPAALL